SSLSLRQFPPTRSVFSSTPVLFIGILHVVVSLAVFTLNITKIPCYIFSTRKNSLKERHFMFKKISMVTVLSMTLLFGGVFLSSVNAGSTYHNYTIETYSMGNALPFYHHNNCFSWMQNESHEPPMTQEQKQVTPTPDKKESNKTDENQLEYQTDQAEQERQHPSKQQNQSEHQDQLSQFEQEVVALTNEERQKHGLEPLKVDWELSRVAQEKSRDMALNDYFSHNSPTYGSPFQMMQDWGISYTSAGENIAKGQRTPSEVVNAWMNSEGHRANILNE